MRRHAQGFRLRELDLGSLDQGVMIRLQDYVIRVRVHLSGLRDLGSYLLQLTGLSQGLLGKRRYSSIVG